MFNVFWIIQLIKRCKCGTNDCFLKMSENDFSKFTVKQIHFRKKSNYTMPYKQIVNRLFGQQTWGHTNLGTGSNSPEQNGYYLMVSQHGLEVYKRKALAIHPRKNGILPKSFRGTSFSNHFHFSSN